MPMRKVIFITLITLLILIGLGVGALSYRLSKGPIDLAFAEDKITSQFEKKFPDLQINFQNPKLDWSHKSKSVVINISNLIVKNDKDIIVTDFPNLSFGISLPYLIGGEIIPTSLEIESPKIQLYRNKDNQLSFQVLNDKSELIKNDEQENSALRTKLHLIIDHISTLYIKSGNINIIDEIKQTTWHLNEINLELSRQKNNLMGDYEGKLILDNRSMDISGTASHDIWERSTNITTNFNNIDTSDILKYFPKLKFLSYIQTSFKGSFKFHFKSNLDIISADLNFISQKGFLDIPQAYKDTLAFDQISFKGEYDGIKNITLIQDLEFKKDDYSLNFAGTATQTADIINLQIDAFIRKFPVDLLDQYWPPAIAEDSRSWLTKNLSKGIVNSAWIILNVDLDAQNYTLKKLENLHGEIDASNVTVNYYKNMPKITNIDLEATFDQNGFDIVPKNGKLDDLSLLDAHIVITGFQDKMQYLSVDTNVKGSFKTVIGVLDHAPLYYIKGYGLDKNAFSGKVSGKYHMDFPLKHTLERRDMKITADANVQDMGYTNLISKLSLIGADFNLTFDNKSISIEGKTSVTHNNNRPLNFSLKETLSSDNPTIGNRIIKVSGPVNAESLGTFIPDVTNFVSGNTYTNLTLTTTGKKNTKMTADVNLQNAILTLPNTNYIKKHGRKAGLTFNGELNKNFDLMTLTNINLNHGGTIFKGEFYPSNNGIWEIIINDLNWGGKGLKGFIKHRPTQGYDIDLTGPELNIDTIIKSKKELAPKEQPLVNIPNFNVNLDIQKLIFKPGKTLQQVRSVLQYRNNAFDYATASGVISNTGTKFLLDYQPRGDQRQEFFFKTKDFGAFIDHVGGMSDYSGGDIEITGSKPRGAKSIKLLIDMGKYKSIDSPTLKSALDSDNQDIKKLKSQNEIKFDFLDAAVIFNESNFMMNIEHLKTKGPSIGITAKGNVDFYYQTVDLKGLFAPAQTINKIINFIPILGKLLTGSSGNLVVIEYKMKGSFEDPKITVNPLATLVPGILRDFFIK